MEIRQIEEIFNNLFDGCEESDLKKEIEKEYGRYISLTKETGEEIQFEILDIVRYKHLNYIVLLPANEDYSLVLEVLKDEENSEFYFQSVDFATETAVYEIFRKRNAEVLQFED